MDKPKHTPGPWERRDDCVQIPYRGPRHTATAYCGTKANARLIAAAPDLYEALNGLVAEVGDCCMDLDEWDWFNKARAALAKAEGKP